MSMDSCDIERERDEALAQVAVLLSEAKMQSPDGTWWCAVCDKDSGHESDCVFADPLPKARVLLDRLRRAEGVVRDLTALGDDWIDVETAGFYRVLGAAQEVVAAWEEGK